jgi:glycosyltransferase involved in cell wall biosynthesis
VDLEYFHPTLPKSASNEIVFTGVMDYFPNIDGVLFFANDVLPAVRKVVPGATFTVVGARPTRIVSRLAERPGITVTGAVPDVRPFLERAAVTVAPLRLARGIQNKALESLAMATPAVVSSPVARGIDAEDGEGILVADGARDVAARIVALLRNPEQAREVGEAGRRLVERRHVWDDHCARLEELLERAANLRADGNAGSIGASMTNAAAVATG